MFRILQMHFLKIDFVFFMQHDKTDEFSVLDAADTKAGLLKTTRLLGEI